ncbi:MAG: hypothetical protein K2M55_06105 [Muribaculaceae bacterium]|nr:hypothetical protein [Muribaculaceae bacterium]
MDNEERNPRQELYVRFRNSLKTQKSSEIFYDEDELVELFDYAGSLSDDYIQLEALLCGARLYPDSTALADRRLMLYMDTTDEITDARTEAAAHYLEDHSANTPVADMARLEINPPGDRAGALSYLIGQYEQFTDEEIIELCQLAVDLDQYEWLKANIGLLSKKVRSNSAMLYEVARAAENKEDWDTLISTAETLIEADPFQIGSWLFLLNGQAHKDLQDDARSTYDYAKTIASSQEPQVMLAIADTVYNSAPFLASDMVETLLGLATKYPDAFGFLDAACAFLALQGNMTRVSALLKDYLKRHPDSFPPLRQLLLINAYDTEEYIEMYLNSVDIDEAMMKAPEVIERMHVNGNLRCINALLESLDRRLPLQDQLLAVWIESLFASEKYDKVIELCERPDVLENTKPIPHRVASVSYMYGLSLLKVGRKDDAVAFVREQRQYIEMMMSQVAIPIRMLLASFITFANRVENHLDDDRFYWEYFDMLGLGKMS